ncbi:hypothetical protein QCL51_07120 [Pseudomonas sp. LTR0]|uniref:hypothetical protein n=1 Tax=Pseudomonas sp. LTR0 TaxID=3040601 RepID=UPI0030D1FE07
MNVVELILGRFITPLVLIYQLLARFRYVSILSGVACTGGNGSFPEMSGLQRTFLDG